MTNGRPWTEGFYGIYSFKIDSQITGLITRTPGEYSSTMISLWVYDLKADSITNNVQLADILGDAGAAELTNSYLFFDNKKKLNALTFRHYSYDHSVEDESDSTVEESYNYYLRKIKTSVIDTLLTDSAKLNQQFPRQLRRLTSF